MVQKITIFEPHIEQIGPATLPSISSESTEESTPEEEASGGSIAKKLAMVVGGVVTLGIIGAVLYRRRNGHSIEIEEITEKARKVEA